MTLSAALFPVYHYGMSETRPLKEKYTTANCCHPSPDQPIVGYFSHDDQIKVHRADCANLAKTDQTRLVTLTWDDIIAAPPRDAKSTNEPLSTLDLAVLRHHRDLGVDYSHKVARTLNCDRQQVFESHRRLRDEGLLERVEPTMIQYRKGIVSNKWIKHRNHTYYRLTERGAILLAQAEALPPATGDRGTE